jgi:hypothetical protein
MTRKAQIAKQFARAWRVLTREHHRLLSDQPGPTCHVTAFRKHCIKRGIETAVACVAEARAEHEACKTKRNEARKARRRMVAGLQRARAAYSEEAAPTLDPAIIDRWIEDMSSEQHAVWSVDENQISILDERDPKDLAVELARHLLHGAPSKRKGREELSVILPATTRTGVWCRLAAILYGEPGANLFQHVRKAAKRVRGELNLRGAARVRDGADLE